jgi:hypothetical protein
MVCLTVALDTDLLRKWSRKHHVSALVASDFCLMMQRFDEEIRPHSDARLDDHDMAA